MIHRTPTQHVKEHAMHHRPSHTSRLVALIAAVGALVMSSVVAAPTASAGAYAWPTIKFLNHATVRADGAGAIVQISFACTELKISVLEVGVTSSRADGSIAGAGGYALLERACTTEPQVVSVPLAADNLSLENSDVAGDGGPLQTGRETAVAFASCLGYNCRSRSYRGQPVAHQQFRP